MHNLLCRGIEKKMLLGDLKDGDGSRNVAINEGSTAATKIDQDSGTRISVAVERAAGVIPTIRCTASIL